MKKPTLKTTYQIGSLVKDKFGTYGIVIYASRNKLIVKNKFSTTTYTEVVDLDEFIKENHVVIQSVDVFDKLTN